MEQQTSPASEGLKKNTRNQVSNQYKENGELPYIRSMICASIITAAAYWDQKAITSTKDDKLKGKLEGL